MASNNLGRLAAESLLEPSAKLKTTQGALQTFMRLAALVTLGSIRLFAAKITKVRFGQLAHLLALVDHMVASCIRRQ